MTARTRMNVYFDPELLKQVEALSLRRQVSKSAIVEAAVASFLSGDTSDRLEAASTRSAGRSARWTKISPCSARPSPCSFTSG
mgnify:CR=1 FL=1